MLHWGAFAKLVTAILAHKHEPNLNAATCGVVQVAQITI
jgi:hypothetical protein